jgi:hypothetical protein
LHAEAILPIGSSASVRVQNPEGGEACEVGGLVTWRHAELSLGVWAHLGEPHSKAPHMWESNAHISLLSKKKGVMVKRINCH